MSNTAILVSKDRKAVVQGLYFSTPNEWLWHPLGRFFIAWCQINESPDFRMMTEYALGDEFYQVLREYQDISDHIVQKCLQSGYLLDREGFGIVIHPDYCRD